MYWTFLGSVTCTFLLSYPATHYVVSGIRGPIEFTIALGFVPFTITTFMLGFFMSLGKAAVYKHVPVYYPGRVGPVGGVVGLIGGLGGFVLPVAFGAMNDLVGVWTSCFMLLFAVAGGSLLWMHAAILHMQKERLPEFAGPQYLPEIDFLGRVLPSAINTATTSKSVGPAHVKPAQAGALVQ
jgi:NNP family nitrate/nitrite transporter-like MFS transporter